MARKVSARVLPRVSPRASPRVSERVSARLLARLSARLLARLFARKNPAKSLAKSLGLDPMHDSQRDSLRDSFFYAGMEDPICQTKMLTFLYENENWYSEVFGVADYESELSIQKFKMVNPMWPTKIAKSTLLG